MPLSISSNILVSISSKLKTKSSESVVSEEGVFTYSLKFSVVLPEFIEAKLSSLESEINLGYLNLLETSMFFADKS